VYYKCTICTEPSKIFCEKCIGRKMACVDEGHGIIMERNPYTFWCENISEKQLATIKYITEPPNANPFELGEHFFKIKDYAKARKYYEKFLERGGDPNPKNKLIAQRNLGILYKDWDEESKGEKMLVKALENGKLIRYGQLSSTDPDAPFYQDLNAELCFNLGGIYEKTKNYLKAKELYLDAVRIRKGTKRGDLVEVYTRLIEVLKALEEYSSAMDYMEKLNELKKGIYGGGGKSGNLKIRQLKAGPFKKCTDISLKLIR